MTYKYQRTVAAAVAETKSKFALAEALATEIPPRRPGPGPELTVTEHLTLARVDIERAGGEARTVQTLAEYRETALWVSRGTPGNYQWIPGISFTAHNEAHKAGLSYEEFAADPKGFARTRREAKAAVESIAPSPEAIAAAIEVDPAARLAAQSALERHSAAEWQPKARQAAERDKDERRAFMSQFIEIEGHYGVVLPRLRKILEAAEGVPFSDEVRGLISESTGKARALIGLIDLCITGETNVDWDAELRKLEI